MSFTELCKPIFVQSINDYHKTDNVDTPINNPYEVKKHRVLSLSEKLD